MTFLLLPVLLLHVALTALPAQSVSCSERKARLALLLQDAGVAVRRRKEEVRGSIALSEVTREKFRKSAEWLLSWLRDQGERLERGMDCEGVKQLAADAKAQMMPVHLAFLQARATLTVFAIDQLLLELPEEDASPSAREKFQEARGAFHALQEMGAVAFEEFRARMRRALFLTRQGLRSLRSRVILE